MNGQLRNPSLEDEYATKANVPAKKKLVGNIDQAVTSLRRILMMVLDLGENHLFSCCV